MSDNENVKNNQDNNMYNNNNNSINIPKSPQTDNTYKDFFKICRAYYNELLHLSKEENPKLSKDDIIVIDDLIKEVTLYSNELLKKNLIEESRKLIDISLVIVDFLLKIFGSLQTNNSNNNDNLVDKLSYPLSLKLILLEENFNILFKYQHNYIDGEKNLEEIIEIQKYLKLPNYNLSSSKFYLGIIKFYNDDLDSSEKFCNEALELIELNVNNNNEDNKKSKSKIMGSQNSSEINFNFSNPNTQDSQIEKRKIRKISNILEFLAELYQLKKNYRKVIQLYEKAYYLNLGKFGSQNINTEYFKTKLDIINVEIKKYSNIHDNNMNSNNIDNNDNNNINFNTLYGSFQGNNTKYNNNNNSIIGKGLNKNILHKGKADTFCFKIPTSNLYEPLLISIYDIGDDDNNRYSPDLYVCNLCFDKMKLMNFLECNDMNNINFYTDDSLNKILSNITLVNGYICFLDVKLKNALIHSSLSLNYTKNTPDKNK